MRSLSSRSAGGTMLEKSAGDTFDEALDSVREA